MPGNKHYEDLELMPRRWFPLLRLDGYILREFLIKYSVLLLVFVILFVLSDVYRDISDFLDAGASWFDVGKYLVYRLPGNIRFILPITMLLGCMWTMATFGKNMEITAMRASGVSLFRCGGSIFMVGLIVTGIDVWFNEALVPFTERRASQVMDSATGKRSYDGFLTFRSDDGDRQWLFKTFTDRDEQTDVVLKTTWTREMLEQLLFRNGRIDRDKVKLYFPERAETMLKLPDGELEKSVERALVGRMTDLVIDRAFYDGKKKTWRFENGRVTSYDRGTANQKDSAGTSVMHDEVPFEAITITAKTMPETPVDIGNAVKDKEELPTFTIGRILRNNPDLPARVQRIYRTIFYYRLAFPWSCFLAVFLGIPLATKNERTGSLMAIITAVLIIVVYLVTAQVFLVLGKNGTFNPMFAGLAPTVAFVAYGIGRIYYDRN